MEITPDKINYFGLCDCIKRIEFLCNDTLNYDEEDIIIPDKVDILRAIKIITTGLITYDRLPDFITFNLEKGFLIEYKSDKYRLDIITRGEQCPEGLIFNTNVGSKKRLEVRQNFYFDMIKEIFN